MKRLRYIKAVIFIIFLSKLHQTAASAIKTKLLQIKENSMSLVEVGDSERKRKKKLVIVDAILFLIQKFEKSFGRSTSDEQNKNNPSVDEESSDSVDEDADKAFLLSILPDFKNLNDNEKLEFRLHTLHFFKNIRMSSGNGCGCGGRGIQPQILLQQPFFAIQQPSQQHQPPTNHPMLSQYFLNYHSQQSLYPGSRENNFPPSYVAPSQPLFAPTTLDTNQLRRQEPIFCDSLTNSKNLDDFLYDLK